jgi:hydrogenase maturation protease
LVLGFGNPLAGDDAVGLVVVRVLAGSLSREVVVEETAESFLVLLDYVQRYQHIVVVDAVLGDSAHVGEVRQWDCAEVDSPIGASAGSHGMGLDSVMGLARAAGCEPLASVSLVGIGIGYQPTPREGLSRKVRAAVPKAVAAALHEIRRSQGAFARENDLVAGQEMRSASGLT